jgi:hypothetical protein
VCNIIVDRILCRARVDKPLWYGVKEKAGDMLRVLVGNAPAVHARDGQM